jgi:hypothetical protein
MLCCCCCSSCCCSALIGLQPALLREWHTVCVLPLRHLIHKGPTPWADLPAMSKPLSLTQRLLADGPVGGQTHPSQDVAAAAAADAGCTVLLLLLPKQQTAACLGLCHTGVTPGQY